MNEVGNENTILELRWLTRQKKNLPPAFNIMSENAKERVLQYRITGLQPSAWSEWRDAPDIT